MSISQNKRLFKYVFPTILSSVCFFLFTIIDGIFVGRGIGADGLGAVNIVFPFVMVVGSLFMLSTVGGVTVAAVRLGRGDSDGANAAFMHSLTVTVIIAAVMCFLGMSCTGKIVTLLGAGDTYRSMVADYLFWYSLFIIPSGLSTAFQGFCRNDGSPVLVSAAVIAGTAFNIFGDWYFIFPLGMGLKGAAIATGISQTITLIIVVTHFAAKKGKLRIGRFKPSAGLIRKIAMRGLPESISQLSTPVTTLWMNYVLLDMVGDIGVNSFSVISYVASFSVAIFFGAAQGLQPLFGQCYGARRERELKYYLRAGLLINGIGSALINVLLIFVGGAVCSLFGVDSGTLDFTITHMHMFSWGFVMMALNTMISAYLYSTKRSKQAIVINVLRSFVVNSAVILILPRIFGSGIIWFAFGIYETIVFIAAVILLKCSERDGVVFK